MERSWELGINHQSPLIYWLGPQLVSVTAGNQSPIPLIYCGNVGRHGMDAGNQSPIPFDILRSCSARRTSRWESITNPL